MEAPVRRVVITGIGIVSSIGNNVAKVEASLRADKSGIVFVPDHAGHGFRCRVHGQPNITLEDHIDKRDLRFMGVANGSVEADGEVIYQVTDMKVALSEA